MIALTPRIPVFPNPHGGGPVSFRPGPRKALTFGEGVSYRDILAMPPAAKLTPAQGKILKGIEELITSPHFNRLGVYLDLLKSPAYTHLLNIRHRNFDHPVFQESITVRNHFNTPFTDFFEKLSASPSLQKTLIHQLAQIICNPSQPEALKNSARELTSLYFHNLRPGGKVLSGANTPQAVQTALSMQQEVLTVMKNLLQDSALPSQTRHVLKSEIGFAHVDLMKNRWLFPQSPPSQEDKDQTQQQVVPLLQIPVPDIPVQKVPVPLANALKLAIQSGDIHKIGNLMNQPAFKKLIPDWERATGPNNYQHADQDFTLGDHLKHTLLATQASTVYQQLTPEEQFRVSTAALFHDIAKRTGPRNLWEAKRIMADFHHPWRSAETVRNFLPALHYTPDQIEDIHFLILRHQNLGNIIKPGEGSPPPERLDKIADRCKTHSRLSMLKALTEGDILSVKWNLPQRTWFTPEIAERLNSTTDLIESRFICFT